MKSSARAIPSSLAAGTGSHLLCAVDGQDLAGGAGNDTYIAHAGDTITDTQGLNTIQLDALRADIQASLDGGSTRLNLGGNSAGNNSTNSILISNANTNGSTRINFKDGNSTSLGQLAASTLATPVTSFNDNTGANLYGGTQADTLYAFGSNSIITGGKGNDSIYVGGTGSQVNYQKGDGVDTLSGYSAKAVVALGGAAAGDAYYEFSSCLRPNLLAWSLIQYPETAKKASPHVSESCKRARSGKRVTPNSIAACARKQGVRC